MSEFNCQNAENAAQAEIKYPIVLHQNTSADAKPPYKVLRYPNGDFIQLIDIGCKRFNDPSISGASYAIALFRVRPEEVDIIETKPERLDFLASMLYAHVPEDRFVRASVVIANKPVDIKVKAGCKTIDKAREVEETLVYEDPLPEKERKDPGRIDLAIRADILTDYQRDTLVFAPLRSCARLNGDDIAGLTPAELMSLAFVYSKCDLSRFAAENSAARNDNFNYLLNAVAEWFKTHAFYTLYDLANDMPLMLYNNGAPFTAVFSECAMAEGAIAGNELVECRPVEDAKAEYFRCLLDNGIEQFIVDGNPTTLSAQGYMNYMNRE